MNTTSILGTDLISASRTVINNNFAQRYTAYKSTSSSVVSATLQNDSELVMPIGANESWALTLRLVMDSATAPDFKCTFAAPVGTIGYFVEDDAPQTPASVGGIRTIQGQGVGTTVFAGINGVFINNSVAGSLQFQWAQNTNTPSSVTTVFKGSNIIATKLN